MEQYGREEDRNSLPDVVIELQQSRMVQSEHQIVILTAPSIVEYEYERPSSPVSG